MGRGRGESEIKAVRADHITAIYPAGETQEGNERILKAGENNMINVQTIDREKTNKIDIKFNHEMCQVEIEVIDQTGKKVAYGEGNEKINSMVMNQPSEMTYNLFEGSRTATGENIMRDMKPYENHYVIPGGDNYTLEATYTDSKGQSHEFIYTPDYDFIKNDKYIITLKMNTGEKPELLDISVSVEEWEIEKINGEFEKVKDDDDDDDEFISWVDIPEGTFNMGSPKSEFGNDEKPIHAVKISAFRMSKYEVTFEQYDKFCEETGREKPDDSEWGRGKQPVINVSWNDATAFCEWAGCRLPTEAEWEYACRAGTSTRYYWGEEMDFDYCWMFDNSGGKAHPVGEKKPNAWGLYDMSGNVQEWCSDWYDSEYYSNSPDTDPQGPEEGKYKCTRGGWFYLMKTGCRSAKREKDLPDEGYRMHGFRVAKDI